jgi:DNA topoisomerase IA
MAGTALRAFCRRDPEERLGASQQAHFQQRQGIRSLCHHPHGHHAQNLSEPEQKIYDLVTKRFLAIFYPAAEYNITTRITRVEKEAFKTDGKVLVTPGWLAVYGKESQER